MCFLLSFAFLFFSYRLPFLWEVCTCTWNDYLWICLFAPIAILIRKNTNRLNESELIFILISIHTILSLNVYIPEYQRAIEKVQSFPSKHTVLVLLAEDKSIYVSCIAKSAGPRTKNSRTLAMTPGDQRHRAF